MNFNLLKSLFFSILEALSPQKSRASKVVNSGLLTKPSMKQTNNHVKSYDALDVAEGFSLASEQAEDFLAMIKALDCVYASQISLIRDVYNLPDLALHDLERLFGITRAMIHDSAQHSKSQQELYISQC